VGEGANVATSSRNKHKQQPKCSTTALVTQFKWPTRKLRASEPFCAKSTNCRRNSTKCAALARLSRASSRGSIAWTAAYRLDAPLPARRKPTPYPLLHIYCLFTSPPPIRYRNRHTLVLADTSYFTRKEASRQEKTLGDMGRLEASRLLAF
jgi:hypothetical protein